MTNIAQIEDSIRALPAASFVELMDWMERRHVEVLREQGREPPELEAAMIKALEGPWHVWNDDLKNSIRQNWKDKTARVA